MFYGEERTAELKEIIYGPLESDNHARKTSINQLGNLITLTPGSHSYWNKGIFALKHISGGGYEKTTEMVLELEWLPDHPELSREGIRLDQPVENTSAPFLEGHALLHVRTRQIIDSCYRFTLTTANSETLPLPDERLINLQWFMSRVLRMSGAVEPEDLDYDETPPIVSPVSSVPSLVASPDTLANPIRPLSSHPPSLCSTVFKKFTLKKWAKRVFKLRQGSGNEQVSL
jgi:hypothetical protein